MIKRLTFFVVLFLTLSTAEAQRQRWVIIEDERDRITYIDTTSISIVEDQLLVWVIENFRDAAAVPQGYLNVHRIRSRYLFNRLKEKYVVVGQLFYDRNGRIVGEDSKSLFSNTDAFLLSISDNPRVEFIFLKVNELLGEKNIENDSLPNETALDTRAAEIPIVTDIAENETTLPATGEADSGLNENIIQIETNEETPQVEERSGFSVMIVDTITGNAIRIKEENDEKPEQVEEMNSPVVVEPVKTLPLPVQQDEYNIAAEKNVTNTIFSDGKLFAVQHSSWKQRNIAEKEMQRLKKMNYNASIVEARPFNRDVWYRVRIGYFNSLEEARSIEKKVK